VPLALYGAEEIGNGTPLQTALALAAAAVTVGSAFHAASDEPELEEGRAPASADAIPVGSPAA
jgi:hypothetical protein